LNKEVVGREKKTSRIIGGSIAPAKKTKRRHENTEKANLQKGGQDRQEGGQRRYVSQEAVANDQGSWTWGGNISRFPSYNSQRDKKKKGITLERDSYEDHCRNVRTEDHSAHTLRKRRSSQRRGPERGDLGGEVATFSRRSRKRNLKGSAT